MRVVGLATAIVAGGTLFAVYEYAPLLYATMVCFIPLADAIYRLKTDARTAASIAADITLSGALLTYLNAPDFALAFMVAYFGTTAVFLLPSGTALVAAAYVLLWALAAAALPPLLDIDTGALDPQVLGAAAAGVFSIMLMLVLVYLKHMLMTHAATQNRRIQIAEAVSAASHHLLDGHDDGALQMALEVLRPGLGASGVFVERNDDDPELGLCSTIIATAAGDPEWVMAKWQRVPWDRMPQARAVLSQRRVFAFDVTELSGTERDLYEDSDVASEVDIPIFIGTEWVGIFGVTTAEIRTWTAEELELLTSVAGMVGSFWRRRSAEAKTDELIASLDGRVRYERALAACSRSLLTDPDGASVDAALDALIAATGVDYVFVDVNVEHPAQGLMAKIVHEVAAPGKRDLLLNDVWTDPVTGEVFVNQAPYALLATSYAALSAGMTADLRTRALDGPERAYYEQSGVASELNLPIFVDGEWSGSVGYASVESERHWEEVEIELLRTVAEMFGAQWENQRYRSRLERLVLSKDEFVASVSHELRTPLTSVVGFALELRDRPGDLSDDEARELIALVAEQSVEVANLVEDLLVAARTEVGTIRILPEPVYPLRVAHSLITEGHVNISRGDGVVLEGDDVALWADPIRVRQIVRNLLTNAVRYGGENIVVGVSATPDTVTVTVADDGTGIPESDRDRIFEPYNRAHQVPTQPGSVGLGLTVSRRLAHLMGGDLTYDYANRRSAFHLELPRFDPLSAAMTEPEPDPDMRTPAAQHLT